MTIKSILPMFCLLAMPAALIAKPDSKPNILFIMVDEMKWNVMSCAGHPIVKTPNLDRLAREGTRFATAYTAAAICTPSRYSFFTGRYAHVHGSTDNDTPPREPQVLLPSILKHNGYETAISGKLHFIPNNLAYGFDYFWSFTSEGPGKLSTWPKDMEKKHGRNSTRRLEIQPYPDDNLGHDLGKLKYPKEDAQTFWITDRAVDFLKLRDKEKPFFLFVSYLDPHSPSHLCDPYWNMFDSEKMPLPPSFHQKPGSTASAGNRHEVNDPNIVKAMTAAYYAKVTMVDDNVGRLMQQMEEMGVAENTLIVFTADHGNMLGDLNRWFKGVMYESSSRIPLLMKAPRTNQFAGHFNRGQVISNIVESVDVMPTLCEMTGVPLPKEGIQGRSLTGLVAGNAPDWKNRAFCERGTRMIRTSEYKLIENDPKFKRKGDGSQYELYDLRKDPLEEHNIAADPASEKVLKDLISQLEAWKKDNPPVPVVEGVAPEPKDVSATEAKQVKKQKKEKRRKNTQ